MKNERPTTYEKFKLFKKHPEYVEAIRVPVDDNMYCPSFKEDISSLSDVWNNFFKEAPQAEEMFHKYVDEYGNFRVLWIGYSNEYASGYFLKILEGMWLVKEKFQKTYKFTIYDNEKFLERFEPVLNNICIGELDV